MPHSVSAIFRTAEVLLPNLGIASSPARQTGKRLTFGVVIVSIPLQGSATAFLIARMTPAPQVAAHPSHPLTESSSR